MLKTHSCRSVVLVRICAFSLWMAGVFGPAPVLSVEVADLYEAEVPVEGQGAAERGAAIRSALKEVIVKITGKTDVFSRHDLDGLINDAGKYVQQYRYRTERIAPVAGIPEAGRRQVLWVSFYDTAIRRSLAEAGIPVWGKTRPETLLWLAVDQDDERYVVAGETADNLQYAVRSRASARGMRVFFPLFDLEDQFKLGFADIWGNFEQAIERASQRYEPDAILTGRASATGSGNWQVRLTLYHSAGNAHWMTEAETLEDAVAKGVDGLVDTLAQRFAQVISDVVKKSVTMRVTDVRSIEDYTRAVEYLSMLDAVDNVRVRQVLSSHIIVRLALRSDPDSLVQHITLGSTLARSESLDAGTAPATNEENILVYRLLP